MKVGKASASHLGRGADVGSSWSRSSTFDRFMEDTRQGGIFPLGCDPPTTSGWDTVQAPPLTYRLIRSQEAFLGSLGNCTGPGTYGTDKDLTLQDKKLFQGI